MKSLKWLGLLAVLHAAPSAALVVYAPYTSPFADHGKAAASKGGKE
jgi:hypothetical protein